MATDVQMRTPGGGIATDAGGPTTSIVESIDRDHEPERLPRRLLHLAIVIPALDEEATVGQVIAAVPRRIPGVSKVDVIVVDDGSRDRTRERAEAAGADAICVHPRPRGLVQVFKTGTR